MNFNEEVTRKISTGFTLIEVLIALAIFAVSITALSTSFQSNASNASLLKEKTFAHWLAQNKMVEMRANLMATGSFPQVADRQDKEQFAGREWLVRTKIGKTPFPGMVEVHISVGVEGGDEEHYLSSLKGYVSDPN